VEGDGLAVRRIPHSPSLTNPGQGLSWPSLPPALNIQSLPGERLHWQQTVENEGAIGVMHRSCFRVVAVPTLAISRTKIHRIILNNPPFFFEGKKIGEKGGHQVAWGALVVRIKKHGPLSMGLTLLVRGGSMMT
jgi:hypothetical protein